MDGIVGHQHDGGACANSGEQLILDLHHRIVFLAHSIQHGKVEVGLDEVVGGDTVSELPVAHGQDVVGVTHVSQQQVSTLVDVEEDVCHVVAIVAGHVVVDELRVLGREVSIGKGQLGALLGVAAHGEETCLRVLALLAYTIVVLLLVGQLEGVDLAAALSSDTLGSHLLELHEVGRLGAEEEVGAGGHAHAVAIAHGSLGINGSVEGHRACVGSDEVALGLTRVRGNEVEVVGVAAKDEEHLLARSIFAHRGIDHSAFLRRHLEVEGIVGAIDPVSVLHCDLRREDGEGGVVGIDVELDGATHGLAIGGGGGQQVSAVGSIEGVLRAIGFTYGHRLIGRSIDQRLDELALRVHCHLNSGGKSIACCQQQQRHET